MAVTTRGTPVNFGFATTTNGITITGISGFLLQSAASSSTADEAQVRDGIGAFTTRTFYNPGAKATLNATVTGSDTAAAITNTAKQSIGGLLVISACASSPDLVATNWVIDGCDIDQKNTDFAHLSFQLSKHAGITS